MKTDLLKTQDEINNYLIQKGYSPKDCDRLSLIIFTTYGETTKDTVNKALELLDKDSSIKKDESKYKLETNTILLSEMIKTLEKEMEPIRIKLFGHKNPPFNDFKEAVYWIDAEMKKKDFDEAHKKYKLYNEARENINAQINQEEFYGDHLNGELKYGITFKKEINNSEYGTVKINQDYLSYKTKNQYIYAESHYVYHSENLLELSMKLNELSLRYRIDEFELLHLFMCGTAPSIKRWESLVHVIDGKKARFEIIINSPDLTLDELKIVYNDYRREMNVKSKKRFSQKQERIINLINEFGEPPEEKGRSDYFKELMLRWNSKYPDNKYSTWQTLYKAYNNIRDSLKRMEVQ